MSGLLSVEQVLTHILTRVSVLPTERVHVAYALDRILAEDINAPFPVPSFANSAMDGYAVRAGDIAGATPETPVFLTPVEDIPAGRMAIRSVGVDEAARIMTGAPLPPGADAVVPVEYTDDRWRAEGVTPLLARVAIYRPVAPGENVRPVGEDIQAGQTVLRASACWSLWAWLRLLCIGSRKLRFWRQATNWLTLISRWPLARFITATAICWLAWYSNVVGCRSDSL